MFKKVVIEVHDDRDKDEDDSGEFYFYLGHRNCIWFLSIFFLLQNFEILSFC